VIDGTRLAPGAVVEQREISQWVFKITKYSQNCWTLWMGWIAGPTSALDAAQLDRPLRRPFGALCHWMRNDTAGRTAKIFTSAAPTRCSAQVHGDRADHPLAIAAAAKIRSWQSSSRTKGIGTAQEIIDTAESRF